MRIGQNPAKSVESVAQPQRVTVAIVTYLPFLGGYYAESLEVLKACLESLWANTPTPFDLMIFDNASCSEARAYLQAERDAGRIQYLVLSSQNVGKGGAWNFLFSAAPGEIIAYADSDIYFFPGWLKAQIEVLERCAQVGMVTGMPLWSPEEFSTATLHWAEERPEAKLERGHFLAWEDYWRHSRSLGHEEAKARQHYDSVQDLRLQLGGEPFFIGAGHFQFVARKKVLQKILPIPSNRPMGEVRSLDVAVNAAGYLRLSTSQWWVQHMGNTRAGIPGGAGDRPQAGPRKTQRWKPLRRLALWLHHKTFEILYKS
jgi:glycosyltransferase involved in cell wall biosynthesis